MPLVPIGWSGPSICVHRSRTTCPCTAVSPLPAAGCLSAVSGCSVRSSSPSGSCSSRHRRRERRLAVSYHAPAGVKYGIVKPRQAVAFARWLSTQNVPLLFGADANTPFIDALDFADTRTHWHTGYRKLQGEPGDDLLVGPNKVHGLDDALRRWLALHPDEMDRLRANHPSGPLAMTHRTGRRKDSPGNPRRFDSVWVSRHWVVRHIEHLYDEGIAAGSDHAPVMVDLDLTARPAKEEETWLMEPRQHQSRIGSGSALARAVT